MGARDPIGSVWPSSAASASLSSARSRCSRCRGVVEVAARRLPRRRHARRRRRPRHRAASAHRVHHDDDGCGHDARQLPDLHRAQPVPALGRPRHRRRDHADDGTGTGAPARLRPRPHHGRRRPARAVRQDTVGAGSVASPAAGAGTAVQLLSVSSAGGAPTASVQVGSTCHGHSGPDLRDELQARVPVGQLRQVPLRRLTVQPVHRGAGAEVAMPRAGPRVGRPTGQTRGLVRGFRRRRRLHFSNCVALPDCR